MPKNSSGGTPILVPPEPVNAGHREKAYRPIEATAITNSTATGMSVSCSGVRSPKKFTSGPNGMTLKVTKAGITAMIGAITKTSLSAAFGIRSSLNISLAPSAKKLGAPASSFSICASRWQMMLP